MCGYKEFYKSGSKVENFYYCEKQFMLRAVTQFGNGLFRSSLKPIKLHSEFRGFNSIRQYSKASIKSSPPKKEPRIRYLFYMFLLSSATIYISGKFVTKKKQKTSFGSEQEFNEYELTTGLKRRTKLINNDKYTFIGLPISNEKVINELTKVNEATTVKVIDPQQLIQNQLDDETKRYSYLLQDLQKENKPLPKGLLTALIKDYVLFYMNTSQGIYDTLFVIKNYPQTIDDASKFENEVAFLTKLVVLKSDLAGLNGDDSRTVNDVVLYFGTVNKSQVLDSFSDIKPIDVNNM